MRSLRTAVPITTSGYGADDSRRKTRKGTSNAQFKGWANQTTEPMNLVSVRRKEGRVNVTQNQDANERANATGDRHAFITRGVQGMVRALPGCGAFPDSRSCGERAADTIPHPLRTAEVRRASRCRSQRQAAADLLQFNFNQSNGNRNSDSRRRSSAGPKPGACFSARMTADRNTKGNGY